MDDKKDFLSDKVSISFLEPEQLMDLFRLTPDDVALLGKYRAQLFAGFNAVAEKTVMTINRFNGFSALFDEVFTPETFTKKLRDFLVDYLEGSCDAVHVQACDRWGRLFYRFGIYPKDFMPFLACVQEGATSAVKDVFGAGEEAFALCKALERYFRLDTTVILDAFRSADAVRDKKEENRRERYVETLERKLARMQASLEEVSQKDMLTGLYNQRGFYDNLYRELATAKRHKWSLSLVYFDLNGFTAFNGEQGRRAGDRLLNMLASSIAETFRESDTVCRYGYDDFCCILPDTNAVNSRVVCKRLIEKFRKVNLYGVAFCTGIADTGPSAYCSADELVERAAKNMRQARLSLKSVGEFLLKG